MDECLKLFGKVSKIDIKNNFLAYNYYDSVKEAIEVKVPKL